MIFKIIFLAVFHFLRIFEEKNRIFLKSMKNLEYNCSRHPDQKIILFGFFQQYLVPEYCWKNPKSMIFCSRGPEQLYSR